MNPGTQTSQRIVVVTGLSGAGKTTALKALEDLGYEAVDHLPLALLGRWLKPSADDLRQGPLLLAIGVDVRTRDFAVDRLLAFVDPLRAEALLEARLVFLTCDDDELLRRYAATRRRHPLAANGPVGDGIACERQLLAPLRACADLTIDTTQLSPGELKLILNGHFRSTGDREMVIQVTSFSYRSGLPRHADLVFDVRFLTNPHYEPALQVLTGLDAPVGAFIARGPEFAWFMASLTSLLEPLVPRYAAEGKSYLTIAVGCTGGRHRSVFVAEQLAAHLRARECVVDVYHRDLVRSGTMVSTSETATGAAP